MVRLLFAAILIIVASGSWVQAIAQDEDKTNPGPEIDEGAVENTTFIWFKGPASGSVISKLESFFGADNVIPYKDRDESHKLHFVPLSSH